MQKRIGHLIHGEEWQTFVLSKCVTKHGAIMQEKVLDQETDIKAWMIENSDDHYEIDISRGRQPLGWEPRHSLGDTLPKSSRLMAAVPKKRSSIDPEVCGDRNLTLGLHLRGKQIWF